LCRAKKEDVNLTCFCRLRLRQALPTRLTFEQRLKTRSPDSPFLRRPAAKDIPHLMGGHDLRYNLPSDAACQLILFGLTSIQAPRLIRICPSNPGICYRHS
jgi:hypothetical protein